MIAGMYCIFYKMIELFSVSNVRLNHKCKHTHTKSINSIEMDMKQELEIEISD